jgi:hypothetical protein
VAIRELLDVVQFSVYGQAAGQAVNNVLHFLPETVNANFTATAAQCLSALIATWRTQVIAKLNDSYTAAQYRLLVITGTVANPTPPPGFILKLGDEAVQAGGLAADTGGELSDPLPTYVAATIRKFSGLAGRTNKGSIRLGTLGEAMTEAANQNKLTAAAITSLETARVWLFTQQGTGVAGDSLTPVIFSKTTLLRLVQPRGDTIGARAVMTGAELNAFVGSQVSRKQRATLGA